MFIDAHSHGMHAERDENGVHVPPLTISWKPAFGAPEELIRRHNQNGLECVVSVDPVDVAFELRKIFGNFVVAVPSFDMDQATAADVEDVLSRGGRGIKFIAPGRSYGDRAYFPFYEVLRDKNAVAFFHTGYLARGIFEPGGLLARQDYTDIVNMRPATLDRIARAFPTLKIVLGHFGNPWWEESWTVLKSNPNIYAEFSGGTCRHKSMSMWKNLFAANGKLHEQSVRKLLFASDGSHFSAEPFEYYLDMQKFYEQFFDALGLSEELRQRIYRGNAAELFGI